MAATLLTDLFIGGKAVPAGDGGRFDVEDPATGEVITSVADGTRLISLENGKALTDARGGRTRRRRGDHGAVGRQPDRGPAPAGRHLRARHAVELPRGDGDAEDRPGPGGRLHGDPEAGE